MTEAPLVNLKMTEKNEEEAVKHSDGNSQAEDKVVESEARGHQQDEQESGNCNADTNLRGILSEDFCLIYLTVIKTKW